MFLADYPANYRSYRWVYRVKLKCRLETKDARAVFSGGRSIAGIVALPIYRHQNESEEKKRVTAGGAVSHYRIQIPREPRTIKIVLNET